MVFNEVVMTVFANGTVLYAYFQKPRAYCTTGRYCLISLPSRGRICLVRREVWVIGVIIDIIALTT